MNITVTTKVTLDEASVKGIIAEYINKRGYSVSPSDIELRVGRRIEGYGISEHEVIYFENCVVQCDTTVVPL